MGIDNYKNLTDIISGSYSGISLDCVADSSVPDYCMFMVPETTMFDLQEAIIEQGVFSSQAKSSKQVFNSDLNSTPSLDDDYLFLTF